MADLTKCALWKDPDAMLARPMKDAFALEWESERSAHFWRYALRCRACGQEYMYQFSEKIDWTWGQDDQMSIYIPYADKAERDRLRTLSPDGFAQHRPRLQKHAPLGSSTIHIGWMADTTGA